MYAFLQNCNFAILIWVKRILSFLARQFSKQHVIEDEHTFKCGNIVYRRKKNKGSSVAFFFYSQQYLKFMVLNDQEYLITLYRENTYQIYIRLFIVINILTLPLP